MQKEEIKLALAKRPDELSKEQLSEIFGIFCFQIKEYRRSNSKVSFEIHFKRTYLVRVSYPITAGAMSFSNEFVYFSEGCHGLSMGRTESTSDLISLFVGMFYANLLIEADYSPYYDGENSMYSSAQEAQEYLEFVQSIIKS